MPSSIFINTAFGTTVPVLFPDGTSALPALSFSSEPTLGFWRSSAATVTLQGNLAVTASMVATGAAGGNKFALGIGTLLNGVGLADGQANITNNASSAGTGLDVTTDAVLKVRTRAQSAYATVDALGYKVSGAAGANFGPSAVASLTVVNGLVTAAS